MAEPNGSDPGGRQGEFATATAVERTEPGAGTGSAPRRAVWSGAVAPGWDIASNANGAYLLAIAARALRGELERPDLVAVSANYLNPGKTGPVTVETEVLKQGWMFASGFGTLLSGSRPLLSCIGTFGDLSQAVGPELVDRQPPPIPDPEDCPRMVATTTFPPPFVEKVELRLLPEDGRFLVGARTGNALMRGWFRLLDDEPVDSIALLCAVDAFPPTAFNADLPMAWTPTLELTVHVRARPEPGWLRCTFATHFVTGGFLEEDGEIWDSSGRLVAQSRQLALVPLPG